MQTVDPYTLSFAPYDPKTGVAISLTDNTVTTAKVFHPPAVFSKVFVHDRQTLKSHNGTQDPDRAPTDYYLMCCDCGS